jgi:predicted O-methyltransferase YrrM
MSSWSLRPHFRDKSISIKPRVPNVPIEELSPQVSTGFNGVHYRLSTNWNSILPLRQYNKPITYLEIGTFYGANLLSVADSYASHEDSILHCIDPWEDYQQYPEYKGQQNTIYNTFLQNIEESNKKDNIVIHRGYSHKLLSTFDDDMFDIIYIDGNHEPEYVLEDAVLSFRKLKKGGILIFDDYGWGGPDLTKRGIDGFLSGYHKRITLLGIKEMQVFIKKI